MLGLVEWTLPLLLQITVADLVLLLSMSDVGMHWYTYHSGTCT